MIKLIKTPPTNIKNICDNWFDIKYYHTRCIEHLGKEIYFSDNILKSIPYGLPYIGEGCNRELDWDAKEFILFVCRINLGKYIHIERYKSDKYEGFNYNSYSRDFNNPRNKYWEQLQIKEYCIKENDKLLPYCLLYFKVANWLKRINIYFI